MDIEKLKKSLEGHGFAFRYFETGAEAADYLAEQMAGKTVGIGGSKTVEAIGLYEKLQGKPGPKAGLPDPGSPFFPCFFSADFFHFLTHFSIRRPILHRLKPSLYKRAFP